MMPRDLDAGNIRDFTTMCLLNPKFQQQFLCSKLEAPKGTVQILSLTEDHIDIDIKFEQLFLKHPIHSHKCGLLSQVEVQIKVPAARGLANDFCNYELRIEAHDGILNLNKQFLQSFLKFFVYLDALLTVIKGIRKLVLRQHFQDSLMYEIIRQGRKGAASQPNFSNYRDTAIPKHLQIRIHDGLQLLLSDSSQQLSCFLKQAPLQSEMVQMMFEKRTLFQMTRTLKDSYYLQVQCTSVSCEVNQQPALRATNFVQELDLTFMKEVTDLPVKLGRMFVEQQIKFQELDLVASPALLKWILEFANFYFKSKHTAAVKHKILGWLSDKSFLLTNIIPNHNEIRLSDEQILEIYEQPKHQDRIGTTLTVTTLNIHSTSIKANSNAISMSYLQENGTIQTGLLFKSMKVVPSESNKVPLFEARNFKHQKLVILPTSQLNKESVHRLQYLETSADMFLICINLEFILSRTDILLDYHVINQVFSRKWSSKYSLQSIMQEAYKNAVNNIPQSKTVTVTKANAVFFKEAMFMWCMSSKRMMCLNLFQFRPSTESLCQHKDLMHLKVLNDFCDAEGTCKFQMIADSGQLIHRHSDLLEDQLIVDSQHLEWHHMSSKEHQDIRFVFKHTLGNLPFEFHFGSFINECIKQVNHSSNWFKQEYKAKKSATNFQYKTQRVKPKSKPKTLQLTFQFTEGSLSFDENPVKRVFVAKNYIAESSAERDIVKLKPKAIYNLLKKLNQKQSFQKFVTVDLHNFEIQWSKPPEFQSDATLFDRMAQLDEANQFLKRELFSDLRGSISKYSASYMVWHCRSFVKPLIEVWGLSFMMQMLTAVMNPVHNPKLFTEQIQTKIFQKFPVPSVFNKMVTKLYFDGSLKVHKVISSVQGQPTFLFANDLSSFITRLISFVDISKSLDPNKKLLPYYTGLDRIRNKNHGKFKITVQECQIEIWPKRNINRFTNKLVVQLYDFEYAHKARVEMERKLHPTLLQHLLCLRSFSVTKDPVKQFETALVNFPLIELQLFTNYNRGTTMNHYLHQKCRDMSSYLVALNAYVTKDFYIEIKLNLPSFGTVNLTKKRSLFLPQLMQSYVINSPVPLINYQRSYLQLLDEIMKEYYNGGKRDISSRVLKKVNSRQNPQPCLLKQEPAEFQIKCNAFLSDLLILFTDFEESDERMGDQIMEPEEIDDDTKRDAYLARYQGLIFSMSNACFQTLTEVSRSSEGRQFKSLSSSYRSNFTKLSAINSRSLFIIRQAIVEVNQPGTMDNYRIFLNFFEVDRTNENNKVDYEVLLSGFKTLFPEYVLENEQIQHQITEAQGYYDQHNSQELFDQDLEFEEFFNFREDDTFAIISKTTYSQDKELHCGDSIFDLSDLSPVFVHKQSSEEHAFKDRQGPEIVRHCLEFDKIRLLYTNKIQELIVHHLLRGFNFQQFRKTEYAELLKKKQPKPTRDFLSEYRLNQAPLKQPSKENWKSHLKKESFFALVLIDPQISCQNTLTKSQLLFALDKTTTAMVHAYSINSDTFKQQKDAYFDMIAMTRLLEKSVINYELSIQIKNMDVYVAPSYANCESSTLWASSCSKTFEQINDGDNDLRKILQIEDLLINVSLLQDTLVDCSNPKMAIDLKINNLACEMDGPSMWHSFCVFQIILLSRGEKSTELVFIEEAKLRDLETLKGPQLRDMIDRELKLSMFQNSTVRPDLAKKLEYRLTQMEFTFYNSNKKFSSGTIENISGKHNIYLNRESTSDLDIDRITLQNHCDSEDFRMVLYPSKIDPFRKLDKKRDEAPEPTTMIKLRTRDKFIVVKDAPWQVYDQIELFIHPTKIQLTHQFYQQFKVFFFEANPITGHKKNKSSFIKTAKAVQIMLAQKIRTKQKREIPDFSSESDIQSSLSSITPRQHQISLEDLPVTDQNSVTTVFPQFLRYMRINELTMQISYFHAQSSIFNIKDLRLRMPPYISHGTFTTIRKALESYEHHCKRNFIQQIPNLLFRQAASMKERVKDIKVEDYVEESAQSKQEMNLAYAKKIILGDFAH